MRIKEHFWCYQKGIKWETKEQDQILRFLFIRDVLRLNKFTFDDLRQFLRFETFYHKIFEITPTITNLCTSYYDSE